jgi:predicted RNA binding protein YcfA (HicA-like mRNA interferase family)
MGLTSRDVIKRLESDGWVLHSVKGSHHHYKHPIKKGRVTVPHPKRDLPKGTLASILKQAQLKQEG